VFLVGENIARIELNKIFVELLRRFDWSLIDPLHPVDKYENWSLFVLRGMWVKVTDREGQ
jgi:cytochrome P450